VPGADWRHPYGAERSVDGLDDRVLVHVTFSDAEAYARRKSIRRVDEHRPGIRWITTHDTGPALCRHADVWPGAESAHADGVRLPSA
jgi:hypothetical protein